MCPSDTVEMRLKFNFLAIVEKKSVYFLFYIWRKNKYFLEIYSASLPISTYKS
jgi:hypothetical protein